MRNGWRKTFSRPSWLDEHPFARLVRHFLVRLLRGEDDPASSEVQLGVGALLGLLCVPGTMCTFIVVDKYSTFLNWYRGRFNQDFFVISIPDKYLFISLAMAITGIVTVLKWDKILPDAQDYLNLAPLPIKPRSVFLANAVAIAIAVAVLAVDVNLVPTFLFPMFVISSMQTGVGSYLQFAAAHAAVVINASIFTFGAVFALLGAISAILPRDSFRACSSWLRGIFLLAFLMLLVSGIVTPAGMLHTLRANPHSPLRFLPSLWFLGMYQGIQQHGAPPMAELSGFVLPASLGVWGLALVSYGLGYRRHFGDALEGSRKPTEQRFTAVLLRFLDLFTAGANDFGRATYRFIVRAMLRSETHRLCIAAAVGLGWLAGRSDGALGASFSAAYVLVLGVRLSFEIPASAPGAWIFRAVLDPAEHETLPVARRVVAAFLCIFVLLPAFALAWWENGLPTALMHTLYLLAMAMSLAEIQLAGFRKIPLTCPTPGFRENLLAACLLQFVGYEFFTRVAAGTELWMAAAPLRFLLLPAAMLGVWEWNRRRRRDAREAGELLEGLTFENIHQPVVERLNL